MMKLTMDELNILASQIAALEMVLEDRKLWDAPKETKDRQEQRVKTLLLEHRLQMLCMKFSAVETDIK